VALQGPRFEVCVPSQIEGRVTSIKLKAAFFQQNEDRISSVFSRSHLGKTRELRLCSKQEWRLYFESSSCL